MDLARAAVAEADIVLWLHDLAAPGATDPDEAVANGGARLLRVGTKSDLAGGACGPAGGAFVTSARTGAGVEALREALLAASDAAGMREVARSGLLLNARHQYRLMDARGPLAELVAAVEVGEVGEEIVAGLLGAILARLGEISGRVFTEQVLADIFTRFCVGK
jgi:tRNA modification GTPase